MFEGKHVNDRPCNRDPETGDFVFVRCFSCESEYGREMHCMAGADTFCSYCGWELPKDEEPDHA